MNFKYCVVILVIAFTNISKSQEIITLPPKAHTDADEVVNIDSLNVIDDEIKSVPLPAHEVPLTASDRNEEEKLHHKHDHRFRLISLDNLVQLNPALQVSIWIFIGAIAKAGKMLLLDLLLYLFLNYPCCFSMGVLVIANEFQLKQVLAPCHCGFHND